MHDFLSFRGIELHSKACNPTPNTGLTGLLNGSSEMALGVPGKAHGWGMSDKPIGEAGLPLIIWWEYWP